MLCVHARSIASIVVFHFLRKDMTWKCFLDTTLAERYGMIVSRYGLPIFISIVLYDLSVAVTIVLKEMGKACNWSGSGMDRTTSILVKPNISFGILDITEGMVLVKVPLIDSDCASGLP